MRIAHFVPGKCRECEVTSAALVPSDPFPGAHRLNRLIAYHQTGEPELESLPSY